MSNQYIASKITGYDDKNDLYEAVIDDNTMWVKSESIVNKEILESFKDNSNQNTTTITNNKQRSPEKSNRSEHSDGENKKKIDKNVDSVENPIVDEGNGENTVTALAPDTKYLYTALHTPIEKILGASMSGTARKDLVFAVKYIDHPEIHFVSHIDMKKYHLYELIDFYEKLMRVGERLTMPPYKKAKK